MADIQMCLSTICPSSSHCRRHKDSGTKASHFQYYGSYEPDSTGRCASFWPVQDDAEAGDGRDR